MWETSVKKWVTGQTRFFITSPALGGASWLHSPFLSFLPTGHYFHAVRQLFKGDTMKRDNDGTIDISDPATFKAEMQRLDRESVCPCAECVKRMICTDAHHCIDYKKWRKKYLMRNY